MKYWMSEMPGSDKLIIWDGNKLYKANPQDNKLREFEYLLKKNEIPEGLFSIYKSQIKLVEMDESKSYLCVYFGAESYEHIRVKNIDTKKEIFEELSRTENAHTSTIELTLMEKTRIQRKAFIALTVFFILGFILSLLIGTGELPDGSYPAVLLFLGALGTINIILIYLLSILIIGAKVYLISKTSGIRHAIYFK
jgi:hypothetical protein